MRMGVVPLDFRQTANGLVPVDGALFTLVTEYCQLNLAKQPELSELAKTWAVVEYEGENIVSVTGLASYGGNIPDIPVFRVTGPNAQRATKMLYDRLNGFFADNGMRGKQVFLFISDKEKPEQRCEAWDSSLEDVGAVPAQRYAVTVR
ncbi:MAG TPA: hypothetical protein VM577_05085 [Anaerovoracaceae bacterium]|nr:hypothetical protein [Anaerovoracaceae bacterium]